MRYDYVGVLVFLVLAVGFILAGMTAQRIVSRLLRTWRPSASKLSPYECGEEPVGGTYVRYNIRFYVIALIFIVFDVEIVLLFPWARVFQELYPFYRSVLFWDMVIFIGILAFGLAYVWAKGDLEWVKTFRKHLSPAEKVARSPQKKEAA
ncbi:MAG: NADH-quinone oxidoreductase subunit A [Candidatus Brocadiae bacterium]|nr:NADH-quinone oxidoreductase subunit A [Candidatus Brocadiia bacterium]